MGIINRDLDLTERNRYFSRRIGAVATGVTLNVGVIGFVGDLKALSVSIEGISGAPTYDFRISRFIATAGYTAISAGATTLTPSVYGTSGLQNFTLASPGSTLLGFTTGDQLMLISGGTNSAVAELTVAYVVQATSDYKTSLGV